MEYLALLVCIGILAVMGWRGYRSGLIKVILYIAVLVISVAVSGFLVQPISSYIKENTSLYENVEKSVREVIDEQEFADEDTINEFIQELPFPEYILEAAEEQAIPASGADAVMDIVSETIALKIFHAIVYSCLMIVIYVVLSVVVSAFNIIARLPVIREVNKLAGLALGLAEGVIILWLLCILVQACGSESWAQEIFVQINENSFLSFLYNHNVIVNILSKYI